MKFSIIIPTFKGAETLEIAISSILNQTYKDFEIIVSDDNEIDSKEQKDTEVIINKIKEKTNKIIYLKNGHHNGSYARNRGIDVATGNYIMLLDDDDFYLENYLDSANKFLEENKDIGLLFFDVVCISKENIAKRVSCPYIDSKSLLFLTAEIGTGSNICFINDIENRNHFDERYLRHQDIEFVCKMMKKYKYKWLQEIGIVKYFNQNDNYPNVDKALKMQELLRTDMLSLNIIDVDEETNLKNKQLHSLYNDLLIKNVSNEELDRIVTIMKESGFYGIIDKTIMFVYKLSKTLFNNIIKVYFKKKTNSPDLELLNKILELRKKLEKDSK